MSFVFKMFVDFDGTISKVDVGDSIFRKFADREKVDCVIAKLLNDEISAKQSWLSMCEIAGNINKDELDAFINTIEIDRSFHELVDYCKSNNIELFVLSDGFDYYIDKILGKEKISGVTIYSNKLKIDDLGKLIPEFPYLDVNFTSSANCKRNHIINHSSDEDYTIFIGDGNSDKYTAEYCDFIFAKDDLLKYCERERITYFPYKDFHDVVVKIEQLLSKKRLKKRHQAELKRREIYMME
jgi:2-hydroxy-3-keto-5-methylthiopentenyl-1-phosphate phosphatase